MSEKLLRIGAVLERTGCKKSKLYAMMATGEFHRPIKVGGCSHWPESQVSAWIERQISASGAGL